MIVAFTVTTMPNPFRAIPMLAATVAFGISARAAQVQAQSAPPTPARGEAARGDTTGADSASRTLGKVVITESRTAAIVGGASALRLSPDAVRASPAPVLDQVLRETPFIRVRRNSRGEMELSVRGSDSRQAAVFVDGVPLTLGWDHRTDPSLIPVTGSEEVEVVRGLGSLLGGPNALGGSVSVSQNRSRAAAGPAQLWGGLGVDEHAAFVGSVGASRTVAARGGTLTVRGGAAHRARDGVSVPGGFTDPTAHDGLRTNSDLRQTDGFASVRWNGAKGRSVGGLVTAFDAERGVPPEEHLAAPRLWRYPYSSRAVVALSGSLGAFDTPFGIGTLDVSAGFNGGRQKIQRYSSRSYATVDGEELGDERTVTGRALLTHSLPRGAKVSAAVTTADVRYTETLTPAAGVDYRQVLTSSGAELDVPIGHTTTIAIGAVYDRATTPETGGRTPAQQPLNNTGWRAGLVRELSPAWRLHASASSRSRFPALRELYSGALDRFRPNPDLKPETLRGLEAGATFHGTVGEGRDANVQVTAFNHRLDDAVVRITLSNPTRFMRVNRDRIESSGAELMTTFFFGPDRARAVSLSADATLQRIRVIDRTAGDAERRAENNPETRATLSLGVPFPGSTRGTVTTRYTGTQYCLHAETGANVRLSPSTVSDVAVERSFTVRSRGPFRQLRAIAALDNAANRTAFDQCGLPQPGRTLRAMFNLR